MSRWHTSLAGRFAGFPKSQQLLMAVNELNRANNLGAMRRNTGMLWSGHWNFSICAPWTGVGGRHCANCGAAANSSPLPISLLPRHLWIS